MLHTTNQDGETIIAVGAKGSHVRNKDEYNQTIHKLIIMVNFGASIDELKAKCEDDEVPSEDINDLIKSAKYYYLNPEKI